MAKHELVAYVKANIADFKQKMSEVSKQTEQIGKKMQQVGKNMSKYVTAPLVGLAGVAVAAYSVQEGAERKLAAAIRATGGDVQNNMRRFKTFASGLQSVTRIGDETSLVMLQMATNMGLNSEAAERATKNAIAMESAFGVNAQSAMRMTVALEQGDATMLKRYIPALRSIEDQAQMTAKAQDILSGAFDVAKEDALTFSGQLTQLKNSTGDLMEEFGNIIAEALKPLVGYIKSAVEWFQKLDGGVKKIIVIVAGLAAVIGPLLITLGFLTSTIIPAIVAGGTMISTAWLPLTAIILGVAAAFAVFNKNVKASSDEVNKLVDSMSEDELAKEQTRVFNALSDLMYQRDLPERKREPIATGDGTAYRMDNEALDDIIDKERQHLANIEEAIKLSKKKNEEAAAAAAQAKADQEAIEAALKEQTKAEEDALGLIGKLQKQIQDQQDLLPLAKTKDEIMAISAEIGRLTKELEKLTSFDLDIPNMLTPIKTAAVKIGTILDTELPKKFKQSSEAIKKWVVDITYVFEDLFVDTLSMVGEAIGTALAGGDTGDFGKDFLVMLADFAKKVGVILLSYGLAIEAFKVSFETLNGVALIVAGGALILAASAAKAVLTTSPTSSGGAGTSSSGTGTSESAWGMRDLRQFEISVSGELVARGNDLVTVFDRENRRKEL